MKTIVEGKKGLTKLLGKQKLKETEYRLMKYVLRAECEDGILLHNVITGHLILLDPEESVILEQLPKSREDTMNSLIESYFLVPMEYDEKTTVDVLRKILKNLDTRKGINAYTIMTTTNCNARCFYCYQANYPHINMSEETANQLVNYMIEHKGQGALHLGWFGGEPLVGVERIKQICAELDRRNIDFDSSMISNAYLFDEEMVEMAVDKWKLDTIQITLDGTEEIYNRTKAYVSVKDNPYRRVLRNIALLADRGVNVSVRLNLGQHNGDDLNKLIRKINEIRSLHGNIGAYAHTLYEDEGYIPEKTDAEVKMHLYEAANMLNYSMIDLGLAKHYDSLPSLIFHGCMADDKCSTVIYPDGRMYKCDHTAAGDEYGDIFTNITEPKNYDKFFIPADRPECYVCPIYPSCNIPKQCEGLKDRNSTVCGFDVTVRTRSLLRNYRWHR